MANSFLVPASRNGLPTNVKSNNGIGVKPVYHPVGIGTSIPGNRPVAQFGQNQRLQVAGVATPVASQSKFVNPTSPRQTVITGALLPQNARTSAPNAPVNAGSGGAISGVESIHGLPSLSVRAARGVQPGGYNPVLVGAKNPIIRRSVRPQR